MRIDVIVVISGLDSERMAARQRALSRFASPGTEVRLIVTPEAPISVESQAEMELAAPGILQRCLESESDGSDAIIIWGGHDPSLDAARELVSIPVIGPGMASIYTAAALARNFALLVQLPTVLEIAKRQVRNLGLESRCSGIYSVNIPVLEFGGSLSFQALRDTAQVAVEAGADAICFGCMAMTAQVDRVAEVLTTDHPGVVVTHPGLAAIRFTEMLVGMQLTHSKLSYPYPPKPVTVA